MSVFLDSTFFIAFTNPRDPQHEKAREISGMIKDGQFGGIFVSTYVFDEVLAFTLSRHSQRFAVELGEIMLGPDMTMLDVTKDIFDKSWGLFKERENLSFTDCTTVKLAESHKIKHIVSFDTGFRQFKSLNVLS